MKIKKVYINNFAGLKDKELCFSDGFNLIFGENEAGKSSIENFIRIWLYGMNSGRGKGNDRKKYMPITGEKISGELYVSYNGKDYIIKRTFGNTKREDILEILDEITGEAVELDYKGEIGKYFLDVNEATFEKTLFIRQLGVKVDKDKEEEIMEKVTNIYDSGDENVSVKKALEKLEKQIKQLSGTRKNGKLDLLKIDKDKLAEELHESYRLAKENFNNEEKLIKKKEAKKNLTEEIQKLEVYKKYIRKTKLKKDFNEISKYLIKGEELKKREKVINEDLNKGDKYITEESLDEINKCCARYIDLMDRKHEKIDRYSNLQRMIDEKRTEMKKYDVFKSMGNNVYKKVYDLKITTIELKEKLNKYAEIQKSINMLKNALTNKIAKIGSYEFIEKNRDKITVLLKSYEDVLKELKYSIENQSDENQVGMLDKIKKKIRLMYLASAAVMLFFGVFCYTRAIAGVSACVLVFIFILKYLLKYSIEARNITVEQRNLNRIEELKMKLNDDEEELDFYIKESNSEGYEDFINRIAEYDKFKNYKNGIDVIIQEKEKEAEKYDFHELTKSYNKNNEIISVLYRMLSCSDLEEVLQNVQKYEEQNQDIMKREYEINSLEEDIKNMEFNLKEYEKEISEKTELLGIENCDIMYLQDKLKNYKEKIISIKEIQGELRNVEETYKALLKDRNIDEIKEEMKEIINQNIDNSYESEEDVEQEIKKKSNELLKIEKEIKDLEHAIEKRYFGKREISEIEEDIFTNKEELLKAEKRYKALNIASDVLNESFKEIRKNVGPELNKSVVNKFNMITDKNYEEAKISENYSLKIRENGVLFDGDLLSNGAKDQLYLSLRLAFIEMLFKGKDITIFLDDAFIQYDDERRKKALKLLAKEQFNQILFFTCQNIDNNILEEIGADYNLINL